MIKITEKKQILAVNKVSLLRSGFMMKIFKTYMTTKELYIIVFFPNPYYYMYTIHFFLNPSTPSRVCIEIGCMVNIF